jgi:oligopeptide transport system substrate-binding protein
MRIEEMLMKGDGVRRAPGMSRKDFLKLGGTGLAGAALLGVAGCGSVFEGGGQGGGGGGGGNKSIAINLGDTIRDLDSTTTTDSVSSDVLLNVMEGLYRLDANTQPQPAQAESVDISEDQLTYTFKLRDGIKWSNGDPVTADDFKYAWLKAINPDTGSQYAYIITTFVKGAADYNEGNGSESDVAIDVLDDKTLKVQLEDPSPFWLGLTSFFTYLPVQQKFAEQQGDKYAQSSDALLYNGPYTLSNFKPTEGVTFVKNDDYWNASNVPIEKIEAKIVKELDTAVNLYESGELDVQTIEGEYVDEYKDSPEYHTITFFATFYMVGNQKEEIFQNLNIRKAIQIGYDRDALVNQILKNGSAAATGLVPDGIDGPGNQTFREAEGPTQPEFDPAKAKELFQKGIEELGGENPTIELLAYDDSTARDIATLLQSQLQDNLGAKIDVKVQPFDRKLELESNGEFQLSWQGWIADYNDPMTFLDLFVSDSSFNTQKYSNAQYDKLIAQAKEELDEDKRMDMLLEAEKILVEDDAGTAPMFFDGRARLQKPFITKYVNHPYGGGIDLSLWRIKG